MQPMRREHGLPLLCLSAAVLAAALLPRAAVAEGVTPSEARRLRDECRLQAFRKISFIQVKDMFYHAFDGYMQHAFPLDELRPLSCRGEDSLGGYALTLIDSLDTLALLGDEERFTSAVDWVGKNVRFDINKTVSVFETNIRILGGLLSAHLIASDYATITSTAGGGTLTLEFGVLSRLTNNTVGS
ncbi:hypothetical protein PR202_ga09481 [Eleusine coracana subsp. coracana]|uniref:alpha-1,2-Mannosidase n=1 Tax=Eleusine coracana subsp. coracana TaxID=191504 RepID=A0AAV5C437_ELECO|nr:hypothetical protein PR202_ga09481 [Eleusine coracana subsp. coracana]